MTTKMKKLDVLGFTLIELIVVILLIGILTAFGVPAYMKALENNKAEDAASVTNMIATANRMYALDHNNTSASGAMDSCTGWTTCAGNGTACDLVGCKYVASMDFQNGSYQYNVGGVCGGTYVACSNRRQSGNNSTSASPYTNWGYQVDSSGVLSTLGGAPMPAQ